MWLQLLNPNPLTNKKTIKSFEVFMGFPLWSYTVTGRKYIYFEHNNIKLRSTFYLWVYDIWNIPSELHTKTRIKCFKFVHKLQTDELCTFVIVWWDLKDRELLLTSNLVSSSWLLVSYKGTLWNNRKLEEHIVFVVFPWFNNLWRKLRIIDGVWITLCF